MALPDAATKLRIVLDYLPCEACLAHPVEDQDLLCTVCARLDRQVAVRVGTRTNVLIERPSPPEAPVVIPPAVEVPQPAPAPPIAVAEREIVVRMFDAPPTERTNVIEVVLEPVIALPPPELAPVVVAAAAPEPEPEFDISDIVDYVPASEEFFDYRPQRATAPPAPPPPPPEPAPVVAPVAEPVPRDDYVFRPPPQEEPAPVAEPEPIVEEIFPAEEVPVESAPEEQQQWAPAQEEEPVEMAPVEEEVLEMEVVEDDDEVVEMEVIEDDEPASPASGTGELYRLRGFDAAAESAFAKKGITEIAHLSGHDAGELAQQTGIPLSRVQPWIQVADLVHEVGVPLDAAIALVAAGVPGPRGLREADADEVADRVAAFGGAQLRAADIRRWKRRA